MVAGAFKRAEPDLAEDALLMRALRDFNIPKIVREDEVVFFGLLGESRLQLVMKLVTNISLPGYRWNAQQSSFR